MFDSRVFHIIRKEFIQLFRDRRILGLLIIAPIIQLIVFGYVATTDVKNIPTAVFDQDRTYVSRDFVSSFKNSGYFSIKYEVSDLKHEKMLLDSGKVWTVINIPPKFSKDIKAGRAASVQFIIDGTNSNSAGIALGYIRGVVFQDSIKILKERFSPLGDISKNINIIDARLRVFHNQELKSVNFMVPGIIALLVTILTAVLMAISIVKEKEYGTIEQLIVSPIKPYELMLGKMVPFIIFAFVDVCLVMLVGTLWFRVPILGSIPLLFALTVLYLITTLGIGLFISAISVSMRQTILSVIFIIFPFIFLSGFIFSIANMPYIFQLITFIIPLRYFLVILRGIFLKGTGIAYLWPQAVALMILGIMIFYMAVKRFRKKLG